MVGRNGVPERFVKTSSIEPVARASDADIGMTMFVTLDITQHDMQAPLFNSRINSKTLLFPAEISVYS